jgi:hypothetical protein
VTSLLSHLRLKKGPFVLLHSQADYSQESDTQLAFRNVSRGGSYYQAKKYQEIADSSRIIVATIYPMFLRTFFCENDFVRETKIVP